MDNTDNKSSYFLLLLDFSLLNIAFFSINYWKRDTLHLNISYTRLLVIFYIVWILISVITQKFKKLNYRDYSKAIAVSSKAAIYSLYFTALIIVLTGLGNYSRLHVFGTWILLFFTEAAIFNIFQFVAKNKSENSFILMVSDFSLLVISFFIVNYYKRGTFRLNPEYEKIFVILIGVWFVVAIITRKFDKKNISRNYVYALASCTKAVFFMTAVMSLLIYAFGLFYFSRLQIYGSIIVLFIGESIVYLSYLAVFKNKIVEKDIESVQEVKDFFSQEELPINFSEKNACLHPNKSVAKKLQNNYLIGEKWLFNFIKNHVDIFSISEEEAEVISTSDLYNINIISDNSKKLFINLHKLNDFRFLNRYFLEIHKKLINGGYFVGRSHTLVTNKKHIYNKYPKYFRDIIYLANFIVHRVLPKLPGIKRIYFSITKGKRRLISRAEILGRLYFCGFKLIGEMEQNRRYYFVVKKMKTVSLDANPTYGPIVKLKRYGSENKLIYTYKFRTMYPYSEYIQNYLYKKNSLKKGGKFNNDFRITTLGKFLRRTWFDEIPMIYNWIKGDLKIFGVRPVSPQYCSLYDCELTELRKLVKPGIIPPYYADLPETIDEIRDSEKNYIEAYLKAPFRTQCRYFGKAMYNILIRGARSS